MKTIHKSFLLSLIINFMAMYAIPSITATNHKSSKVSEPISISFINSSPVKTEAPVKKDGAAIKRPVIVKPAVAKQTVIAKKIVPELNKEELIKTRVLPDKIEQGPEKPEVKEPRSIQSLSTLAAAQVNSVLSDKNEPVSIEASLTESQGTGALQLQQLTLAQVSSILSYNDESRLNRPHLKEPLATNYPKRARRMNMEGMVRLKVLINPEGNVIDAEVIKSAGYGFDEAALDAVRKAKFIPAMSDNGPVTAKVTIPIKFELQ